MTIPLRRAEQPMLTSLPFLYGKGDVVRRMFADVDPNIYVMVDGDDSYDAASVTKLVDKLINEKLEMVGGFWQREVKLSSIGCFESQGKNARIINNIVIANKVPYNAAPLMGS
jgi:hypothetical protein